LALRITNETGLHVDAGVVIHAVLSTISSAFFIAYKTICVVVT